MAIYTKYNTFVENLCNKQIDIFGATDVLKAYIQTATPAPTTDNAYTSTGEIGGSNGYTTGGEAITYTCTRTTDTVSVLPTADITWTASGGSLGASSTGRYFIVYDDTSTGNNVICYFDYGATFTVSTGETMTLDFGATLFTMA